MFTTEKLYDLLKALSSAAETLEQMTEYEPSQLDKTATKLRHQQRVTLTELNRLLTAQQKARARNVKKDARQKPAKPATNKGVTGG